MIDAGGPPAPGAPEATGGADPGSRARDAETRWEALRTIDRVTETPLVVLSLVWLGLLIVELTAGLAPPLELAVYLIWAVFIADFVLEIVIAPSRSAYLRRNWLTAISLVVPAFRVLRVARVVRLARAGRAARSLNLVRVIGSVNRGIGALGRTLARRGAGYVAAITVVVALGGAAGMWAFENPQALVETGRAEGAPPSAGLDSYPTALWWTLMILVTLGSDYWPLTAEGRILAFLLSLYGFGVFGYLTATVASHFVGQDRASERIGDAEQAAGTAALLEEVRGLRAEIARLRAANGVGPRYPGDDGP